MYISGSFFRQLSSPCCARISSSAFCPRLTIAVFSSSVICLGGAPKPLPALGLAAASSFWAAVFGPSSRVCATGLPERRDGRRVVCRRSADDADTSSANAKRRDLDIANMFGEEAADTTNERTNEHLDYDVNLLQRLTSEEAPPKRLRPLDLVSAVITECQLFVRSVVGAAASGCPRRLDRAIHNRVRASDHNLVSGARLDDGGTACFKKQSSRKLGTHRCG
eukprot:scaffold104638_cov69-Phaeocystis_antarctica.AAC.2